MSPQASVVVQFLFMSLAAILFGLAFGKYGYWTTFVFFPTRLVLPFIFLSASMCSPVLLPSAKLASERLQLVLFGINVVEFAFTFVIARRMRSAATYFGIAQTIFEQTREKISHYHQRKTPDELDWLRNARVMREAEALYRRARALEQESGNVYNMAICDEELGYLYRYQEHFEKAVQHLERAASVLQALQRVHPDDKNVLDSLAMSIFRLGEIDHFQGKHQEARKKYQESLAIYHRTGNQREIDLVEKLLRELPSEHC